MNIFYIRIEILNQLNGFILLSASEKCKYYLYTFIVGKHSIYS